MQQVNNDKEFEQISNAKFRALPDDLRKKIDCDLYELNDDLMLDIETTLHKRDSIIQLKNSMMLTDSLAADTIVIPQETYLQQLYRRKLRISSARSRQDSLRSASQFTFDGG
jgi:hypothetical protein